MRYSNNSVDESEKSFSGVILNAYPDSIGGTLKEMVSFMSSPLLRNAFQGVYLLPSLFNSDLDRGFSIIDYDLNGSLASKENLEDLSNLGLTLKLDFVINHLSVSSKQFQDILKHGENSIFLDFFIDWNTFWEGKGKMSAEGYLLPEPEWITDMHFRKAGLPILMVRFPDGKDVPYWNTFYQKIHYPMIVVEEISKELGIEAEKARLICDRINASLVISNDLNEIFLEDFGSQKTNILAYLNSKRKYLGQMDLNIKSAKVWEFYKETLHKLKHYGTKIVRLDAFAYASKEVGQANFLNDPGTWDLLDKIKEFSDSLDMVLLPEIHSRYESKIHDRIGQEGFLTYDFFLPGLVIDALERHTNEYLTKWVRELKATGLRTVNMLGCHDGIPVLDLKGLLSDEHIESLIQTIVKRGGYVKDLHGKSTLYYQVNATYFSALGEDERKLLLARAIQMFMPGIPQVWYLDLFAGKNDYLALEQAGLGGHKEINRTNLSIEDVQNGLQRNVVLEQIDLIRFRNTCQAFGFDASVHIFDSPLHLFTVIWEKNGVYAKLEADLSTYKFGITSNHLDGGKVE